MPTLHLTSYYHYTNHLFLPLYNTLPENENCKNMLYILTTALTPRQFTYVGFEKVLKSFTATRANDFTIEYYDHNIIRPNHDQFLDDDRFANPQLTGNFSSKHHIYSHLTFLIKRTTTYSLEPSSTLKLTKVFKINFNYLH